MTTSKVTLVAVLTALLCPSAADAKARTCSYTGQSATGFPVFVDARAYGISCSTARAVLEGIDASLSQFHEFPPRVLAGEDADGRDLGTFSCRYRQVTAGEPPADWTYTRADCRRIGRAAKRLTVKLTS